MNKIIVTGIDTDAGKTVVAAILVALFKGDYWKAIQSGAEGITDTAVMQQLLDANNHKIFDPAYNLQAPLSPHHAARLENILIDPKKIIVPTTNRTLIIETIGGLMVPLTSTFTTLDLFEKWEAQWVIVSKHYLGSINHTLLTIDSLKIRNLSIAGIIFNGLPNPDTESAILQISKLPCLGRLLPEKTIDPETIQRYAQQWLPQFCHLIP